MSNHVDQFYAAVAVVAGQGDIKQRLVCAFEEHLVAIDDAELPASVQSEFASLRKTMTGVEPLNGEGHIRATVRKMSIMQADACGRKLLDIYTHLVRLDGEKKDATELAARQHEPTVLPPFLVKSG